MDIVHDSESTVLPRATGPVVRVERQVFDPEPAQVVRRRQARLAGWAATAVSG